MTLPKFLLAWADFNWLGFFTRLRPDKDARWSITRVVLLTFMKAMGGASLGLLLALLIYREPVGWLPGLCGLFAGCAGLCWFSVTAVCWNQRATRLRANPALPTALPKTRYRFFRWCLGFIYLVILGVITPFALMVTVENIRGEIAWKRERAWLAAAGEKLTFREMLAPEIPADQNAGMAAIFAPFFDYRIGPLMVSRGAEGEDVYQGGLVWAQSNRLSRLENAFRVPSRYLPEPPKSSPVTPESPEVRLSDYAAAYRSLADKPRNEDKAWAAELRLPPSGGPARIVLAGLSPADEDLAAVCAAATLPRAQFPVHYGEGFNAVLRHLSVMKGVQQVLQLRCTAHLALDETNAAFADATNALNVAELLREEPLLISQLVRYAQGAIAVGTVWQGLADHRWSDEQLGHFQERLGQMDYLPGIVLGLEGERACGIEGINRLINEPQYSGFFYGGSPPALPFLKMLSRGLLQQNEIAVARFETKMIVGVRKAITNSPHAGLIGLVNSGDMGPENIVPRHFSPYSVLINILVPATGKAVEKTVQRQTVLRLAGVACALERYHLVHGEFPEQLGLLSPQFVSSVPLDPMINQPLHYQRTSDGWFLLYSVGLNGKDDGGVMRLKKTDKEDKDWVWPVPTQPTYPRLF